MVARPPRAADLPPALKDLQARLAAGMSGDAARLQRQLAQLADLVRRGKPHDRLQAGVEAAIAESIARVARRRALVPLAINYPEELPVSGARERIAAAIAQHQVVILAGDTGSGKTTQLPKLCLELGRGVRGMIGHTQPRRIAAQAVAARIAEELGPAGAATVAWQVRFADRSTPDTLVKLMTDGILLAEIQHDRRLERYDTIIIDEAHERSLNIDFLLGYLKRLLPERPDLKLVITSATIDVERFARHFDGAPVIQVEGRTYPVEVWYRPPPEEEPELPRAIVAAIEEIIAHERGTPHAGRGDILVFHAGERDIRETALALRKSGIAHAEVLPLYSRLSQAEQASVLRPGARAGRRIVLATNVAETSLTVPGIRYVIDPGLARISRYSVRSKVQRLPIEPIARASAEQRKGRCGRVSEGICVRLFSEEDFAARPAFTDPEILRTGLASVILQMHALGLGEVGRFPFLDPPEERQINDGVRLLEELGALEGKRLTAVGRQLARLPVDPRIGRMLLAAAELGALAEMLVVASFLSVQDPRERPVEKQQAADESHRRFACATSDFVSVLQLWSYVEEKRQALSASPWRRLCQREFLSFMRLREWRDIHYQLRLISRELGLRENHEPASEETLHRAVLAGMLTHIGTRTEERDYEGVRGRRFNLHPGSFVFRKPPKWVVAAELVETTRLYARSVAAIEPEWVLPWAEHLVKREHHSPHWSARAGKVMASERIRLFGLVLSDKRSVDFGRIDPVEARRLFIQGALVEGDYQSRQKFWTHNRALLAEVEALEAKGRRRDLLVEDRVIYDFYDERLPSEVHDHPSLEKWLRGVQVREPEALCMQRASLLRKLDDGLSGAQFPDTLVWQDLRVPLVYRYEPGHPADGVTAVLPLALLDHFPRHLPEWLVPGLLREKLIALLKTLPKQYRKALVPVPDTVDALLPRLVPGDTPLLLALAEALRQDRGVAIPREAWQEAALDAFYRMNLRVLDTAGTIVAEGRDLAAIRLQLAPQVRAEVQRAAPQQHARSGITRWDFGALPAVVRVSGKALDVPGYPAVRDCGETVATETFSDREEAAAVHRAGVRRLLLLDCAQAASYLRRNLLKDARIGLRWGPRFERAALVEDILLGAIEGCLPEDAALPREQADFAKLSERCRREITPRAQQLEALLARMATQLHAINGQRAILAKPAFAAAKRDAEAQLEGLLAPGFLYRTPARWLERLPLYLNALAIRLEKLALRLPRDQEAVRELDILGKRHSDYLAAHPGSAAAVARVQEYRWMLEEYRVSLFAQQLGTVVPVSPKRLEKLWEELLAGS
jgi:ATP-dependent helicase HrpA